MGNANAVKEGRRSSDVRRLAGLLLVLTVAAPLAQSRDPAQPRFVGPPATAVLVDVVVRNANGALVTDLDRDTVEVFEDGARQEIVLFEAPRGRVALRSSAARAYLNEQRGPDEFVGVFAIDRALDTLVPYTRDIQAIEHGLRTAVMRPGCPLSFEGDVPSAASGGVLCSDDLPPRQRAVATIDALTGLIDGAQLVPGRKSALLFSEGIPLESESDVMDRFNAVMHAPTGVA